MRIVEIVFWHVLERLAIVDNEVKDSICLSLVLEEELLEVKSTLFRQNINKILQALTRIFLLFPSIDIANT